MLRILIKGKWVLLGAAVLGVIAIRHEKYFEMLVLRASRPADKDVARPRAAGTEELERTYRFDFTGAKTGDNLFFPSNSDAFWQRDQPHRLSLQVGDGVVREMDSVNTVVSYDAGRLSSLRFYFFAPPPVPYRTALETTRAFLERTAFPLTVDWARYERALADIPVTTDTFVPETRVGATRLHLFLNCNWETTKPARDQIDRVKCRPFVEIEPAPGAPAAHVP